MGSGSVWGRAGVAGAELFPCGFVCGTAMDWKSESMREGELIGGGGVVAEPRENFGWSIAARRMRRRRTSFFFFSSLVEYTR